MKVKALCLRGLVLCLIFVLAVPPGAFSQQADQKVFKQEELDQILAPVALYPDSLLTQVLMASTYPLEVVQADRWAKQNKDMKGDALAKALEAQPWDPSVKSLVNFPQVLTMMSEKLDWTQKLGDAFLAQQKDVMASIQQLRHKAQETGNLKTTKEQVVKVEKEVIIIESASPEVIYVPAYNPTVVYGAWAYPAYPPYPVYPPGYVAGAAAYGFIAGAAVGAAWGYAWGHSDWHGGDVDIDYNRNTNINNNINRDKYKQQGQGQGQRGQGDKGKWQHNPEHRKGVSYRDQGTGQKFNRASTSDAVKSRENFRGRADAGRQDIARGGAYQFKGRQDAGQRGGFEGRGGGDRGGSAFSGMDRGGGSTRDFSSRGSSSRQSMSSGGGGSRGGGGFSGGGSRGGGGGGGSRGGGGGGRGGGGGGRR
jgi:hypothetical protein